MGLGLSPPAPGSPHSRHDLWGPVQEPSRSQPRKSRAVWLRADAREANHK